MENFTIYIQSEKHTYISLQENVAPLQICYALESSSNQPLILFWYLFDHSSTQDVHAHRLLVSNSKQIFIDTEVWCNHVKMCIGEYH